MTTVLFFAGLALLGVLVMDVYSTVFVPRGTAGLLSRQLYRLLWGAWRYLADRRSGERRRLWLAHFGPAMVPLTVAMWGLLLVVSFSLMYAPWVAGFQISPPESGPIPDWALVLYYSGYSAVTLGVGDVTPNGTVPRLMAVIQVGGGFALFTVAVTYLLSIYSARNQSTALALAISRLVGRRDGQDAVSLVVATAKVSSVEGVTDWMGRIAFDLAALIELRGQYPLLHYVHEPNDDRAMPIALTDLLEVVTLCRSVLDPERYSVLAGGPTVVAVERMGRHYLASFVPDGQEGSQVYDRDRRRRYDDARDRLAREGIALRADDEAWSIYQSIARTWDVADDNMREQIGYRSSRPIGTA